MQRYLVNREAVLRVRIDDEAGTLVDTDASVPTLVVTDGDGTVVSGLSVVSHESTGVYKAIVPPRTKMDVYTATWTATVGGYTRTIVQHFIVQAQRVIGMSRLREDSEMAGLSTTAMQRLVDAVEDWFESALGFPPVEQPLRRTFESPGGRRLRVPGAMFPLQLFDIKELDTSIDAQTLATLRVVDGAIVYPDTVQFPGDTASWDIVQGGPARYFRPGQMSVYITHGAKWSRWDGGRDMPEDLVRAAGVLARYVSRTNNYPERARQVATEGALITFSMPAHDRPTGLPEVDQVITRYGVDTSVI